MKILQAENFGAFEGTDPYVLIVNALDRAFMSLYAHVRRNARRFMRLVALFLPLVLLLAASCKTSEMPGAYGSNAGPAQFRLALFPDQVHAGVQYYPAAGYVSRARDYVAGDVSALTRLTEREVGYLFGKPEMERKDANARVWQYRTDSCVVDFYFYGASDGRPVSYVDFRQSGGAAATPRARAKCLDKIAA